MAFSFAYAAMKALRHDDFDDDSYVWCYAADDVVPIKLLCVKPRRRAEIIGIGRATGFSSVAHDCVDYFAPRLHGGTAIIDARWH